jgi:heat shock protein HspQ
VDASGEPVGHPDIPDLFGPFENGQYPLYFNMN